MVACRLPKKDDNSRAKVVDMIRHWLSAQEVVEAAEMIGELFAISVFLLRHGVGPHPMVPPMGMARTAGRAVQSGS